MPSIYPEPQMAAQVPAVPPSGTTQVPLHWLPLAVHAPLAASRGWQVPGVVPPSPGAQ
jgi:hypothetical protein